MTVVVMVVTVEEVLAPVVSVLVNDDVIVGGFTNASPASFAFDTYW